MERKRTRLHLPTTAQRSLLMSRVRHENTTPEKAVRSLLHHLGYRFRLHRRDLPGSPDIVLPKYRTVIFVHGCFWHRHAGCSKATTPKSNIDYWQTKFTENIERDKRKENELRSLGWSVVVVWQCEVTPKVLGDLAERFRKLLRKD